LAEDQKTYAVGIVLSGTGSDGAQGICEIKAMGGITFAQDEHSAKYSGMPHSAAESGYADLILTADEIGRRLAQIRTHPYLNLIARQPAPIIADDSETQYRKVLSRVRAVTGVDFNMYRDTTIKRRILRRMALLGNHGRLHQRLENDRRGQGALSRSIDQRHQFFAIGLFDALKKVYPEIVKANSLVDIHMVPGCSTGQKLFDRHELDRIFR
jgi:two-component system CheB/CheR fusion protein